MHKKLRREAGKLKLEVFSMTPERLNELNELFWNETDDVKTREWRNSLTPYEAVVIEDWDDRYDVAIVRAYEQMASGARTVVAA